MSNERFPGAQPPLPYQSAFHEIIDVIHQGQLPRDYFCLEDQFFCPKEQLLTPEQHSFGDAGYWHEDWENPEVLTCYGSYSCCEPVLVYVEASQYLPGHWWKPHQPNKCFVFHRGQWKKWM